MRYFKVRKEWSASDIDYVIVCAESAQEIQDYYKKFGERGPRYIGITEADDVLILKNGAMKRQKYYDLVNL